MKANSYRFLGQHTLGLVSWVLFNWQNVWLSINTGSPSINQSHKFCVFSFVTEAFISTFFIVVSSCRKLCFLLFAHFRFHVYETFACSIQLSLDFEHKMSSTLLYYSSYRTFTRRSAYGLSTWQGQDGHMTCSYFYHLVSHMEIFLDSFICWDIQYYQYYLCTFLDLFFNSQVFLSVLGASCCNRHLSSVGFLG